MSEHPSHPVAPSHALREAALYRLRTLDERKELTSAHVRLSAQCVGISERTMWRWLRRARTTGHCTAPTRTRFTIDTALRRELAYHRGNAAAVHRGLVTQAERTGCRAPSLATVERAVRRDLSPGDRACLRRGERAARAFDVFGQRKGDPAVKAPLHRNSAWEADHKQAHVEVDVGGVLVKPWITWFVDTATNAICGTAITPGPPNRGSILAALRAALLEEEPYGSMGGIPKLVRIDRGKDFLSQTVASALGAFGALVEPLPAYASYLKGTVEAINGAVEDMLLASMPRYTRAQKLINNQPVDPDQPALTFEGFVGEVLAWVAWWNTAHRQNALDDRTPLQAWGDDPTPIDSVDPEVIWAFTLDDTGKDYVITGKGISWGGRLYIGPWMSGLVGKRVRVRFMPNHDHEIEVFDARTGYHLGRAILADRADNTLMIRVRRARDKNHRRRRADLRAAERLRRQRYAAVTAAEPPRPLEALTTGQALAELAAADDRHLAELAKPDLFPLGPPPKGSLPPIERLAPSGADDEP
ncbi:Mu transposase C-terminal domain-containing protein [Planobispora rosea]|uniref:Mu transposase C-terminal domain-containing protein n=1 Tax=Planobispora rosea TaxID=35762 RepID=UPI001FD57C96|nr:Mu transposase C-terminal domain-containing protein [Planobispora rosea]